MSATRRVDGSQLRDTADTSLTLGVLAGLSQACGLIQLDDLLAHLARFWRDLTQSQQATVIIQLDSGFDGRLALAEPDGRVTVKSCPVSHDANPLDQLVGPTEIAGAAGVVEPTCIVLQSVHSPQPLGRILLAKATLLPEELLEPIRRASAELLARVVLHDQILRDAKLESLAEFAAGAGHEINNPVAAISGRAQLLLREEADSQRRYQLLTIGAQALRIRDMIGDTMLYARPPIPVPQQLNLAKIVERVVDRFHDALQVKRLAMTGQRSPDVEIWADETQLSVVISELLRNAIDASPVGGRIQIDVSPESAADRRFARLTVTDEGPGLTEESREHLFDPFYSGRQAGRGLGFGLSKCWRIVTNHDGQITVAPQQETGFSITVLWPTTHV